MSEKRAKVMRRKQKAIIKLAEKLRDEGLQPKDAAARAMTEVIGCSMQDAVEFIERATR